MSEALTGAVTSLRRAGDQVREVGQRLAPLDPGARAFGAGAPGQLGELGRELYLHWQRALDARAREAAAHGARLEEHGDGLARATGRYVDTDDSARRQQNQAQQQTEVG